MAKKTLNAVEAVTKQVQKAVDSLNKQVYALQRDAEYQKDLKDKATNELLKYEKALVTEREKKPSEVISFYAAHYSSVVWKHVDNDLIEKYMDTISNHEYPVILKQEVTFLPPDVNVCVTFRGSKVNECTLEALRKITEFLSKELDEVTPYYSNWELPDSICPNKGIFIDKLSNQ